MSSSKQVPDETTETESTEPGGLGEVVPEPLVPAWRRLESIQEFRRTHGEAYTGVLEAITALVLVSGYVWWLYLFLVG